MDFLIVNVISYTMRVPFTAMLTLGVTSCNVR